jgi:ABC-type transport system involved in multi-copper enzyme maturation permease subunit
MMDSFKSKDNWRKVGIVIVGGLALLAWWLGWFSIVFYILGLYAAVYIVSYVFRTTAIASFMVAVGGFVLYAAVTLWGLYLLFSVLTIMFTESFLWGLGLLFLLSMFGGLLYFIPMAVGLVLGYPLFFIIEDIEEKFGEKIEVISRHPEQQSGLSEIDEPPKRIYDIE